MGRIVALAVSGLAIFAFVWFTWLKPSDNQVPSPPSGAAGPTTVSIYASANLDQIEPGDSVFVVAEAISEQAILALQLYVNGELEGVYAAPGGGSFSLSTPFIWHAGEAGNYSLYAEAVFINQSNSYSNLLDLIVALSPTNATQGGAGDRGVSSVFPGVPSIGGFSVSPPTVQVANEEEAPAELLNESDALPIFPDPQSAPNGPELFYAKQACNMALSIHDLSNNESAFQVFRHSSLAPGWTLIATLNGQSEAEWLSFVDIDLAPGHYSYYVAAFNDLGSAESAPVFGAIGSNDCVPVAAAQIPLDTLELISLIPDEAVDIGYCYQSLNGGPWTRFPFVGFFTPDEDNDLLGGEAAPLYQRSSETNDGYFPSLDMACWGWRADDLIYLGDFSFDEDSGSNTDFLEPSEINMGLSPQLIFNTNTAEIMDATTPYLYHPFSAADYNMPVLLANISGSISACESHLDSGLSQALKEDWCKPYSHYDEDEAEKYVLWMDQGYCTGDPSECMLYADWLAKAQQEGGEVGFFVRETTKGLTTLSTINSPGQQVMHIKPGDCTQPRSFSVRMFYQPSNGPLVYGHESNPVTTGICIDQAPGISLEGNDKDYAIVEISFDLMEISGIDDAESDPETAEIFGNLYVFKSNTDLYAPWNNGIPNVEMAFLGNTYGPGVMGTSYLVLSTGQHSACPDDIDPDLNQLYPANDISFFCTHQLPDGNWDLANQFYMCESNFHDQCATWLVNGTILNTSITFNNNKLNVLVRDGDRLQISFDLNDWDDASANDNLCDGGTFLGPAPLSVWESFDGTPLEIVYPDPDISYHGDDGDAEHCVVHVSLTTVGP
jgi:hypothetical protein